MLTFISESSDWTTVEKNSQIKDLYDQIQPMTVSCLSPQVISSQQPWNSPSLQPLSCLLWHKVWPPWHLQVQLFCLLKDFLLTDLFVFGNPQEASPKMLPTSKGSVSTSRSWRTKWLRTWLRSSVTTIWQTRLSEYSEHSTLWPATQSQSLVMTHCQGD